MFSTYTYQGMEVYWLTVTEVTEFNFIFILETHIRHIWTFGEMPFLVMK